MPTRGNTAARPWLGCTAVLRRARRFPTGVRIRRPRTPLTAGVGGSRDGWRQRGRPPTVPLVAGRKRATARSGNFGRYEWLTVTDLHLVCRARRIDVLSGTGRDELIALLRSHDAHPSALEPKTSNSESINSERPGWWIPMSVSELRALALGHNVDVPAEVHRNELVELLVARGVLRPAQGYLRSPR
jgi:hypothetical protein